MARLWRRCCAAGTLVSRIDRAHKINVPHDRGVGSRVRVRDRELHRPSPHSYNGLQADRIVWLISWPLSLAAESARRMHHKSNTDENFICNFLQSSCNCSDLIIFG
jgi:hypothetical protein